MEIDDFEIEHLELKYCEYCGGLWLRRKGDTRVYCASCTPYVEHFANLGKRKTKPRLPIKTSFRIQGSDGELFVCGEGGNA